MTSKESDLYVRQHYVPKFMLSAWLGEDRRLTAFHKVRGTLEQKRVGLKGIGFARHLYSIPHGEGQYDTTLEKEFMGPYVDSPAADAYKALLTAGLLKLTAEQKGYWAQFVVSLILRIPRTVEKLHGMARETLGALLDEDPDAVREVTADLTLREYVDRHAPWMYQRVALGAMHMGIQSERMLKTVTTGQWSLRKLSPRGSFDLLLGDQPLLMAGTEKTSFLIAIPLSPRVAFFMFNVAATGGNLARLSDASIAKMLNRETVSSAARYVFATDGRHAAFIEKHLRSNSPASPNAKI